MGDVMKPLASSEVFANAIRKVADIPILGMLVGCGMTLVVQSSSATIAVLQNIASQAGPDGIHSVIGLTGAIPVLLGDNIGTTITAILASLNQTRDAKRTAAAHCIFNVSGSLLFIWFVQPYAKFIEYISPKGNELDIISRQIANAHTGFNIIMTLIWTPLIGVMVKLVMKLLPDKKGELAPEEKPIYLDNSLVGQPIAALRLSAKEIVRCCNMVREMLSSVNNLSKKDPEAQKNELINVKARAETEKKLSGSINEYMERIFSTGALSEEQASQATGILLVLNEIDRISEMCGEIATNITSVGKYSKDAMKDLRRAAGKILNMYNQALDAIYHGIAPDEEKLPVEKTEIDQLDEKMRKQHMERVGKGKCSPKLTTPFNALLHCIDRIGNSCVNLADMASDTLQFKTYLEDVEQPAAVGVDELAVKQ
jgi:Na+/phosphate symporter